MSIGKDIFNKLKEHVSKTEKKTQSPGIASAFAMTEVPVIKEVKSKDWVLYGEDNLYPLKIKDLLSGSAIHNAIVKTKTKMTAGDGFLINGANSEEQSKAAYLALDPNTKEDYDLFLENRNDKFDIKKIISLLSKDLQTFGAYCYELVWNKDFTRISTVKYVSVANIRSGKYVNDMVQSYWYCRDWRDIKKNTPKEIYAFDKNNKNQLNQLVYEKIGDFEYYGEPSYQGGMTWIQTDFKMGIYHLSNIENGMAPSMALNFFKVPDDENEKQKILSDINKNFVGPSNVGKKMVFFSENKDVAPTVNPVGTSGLDKQLLLLAELCDKKILTAHQLTSPLLVGISISGQLSGNTELKTAYQIFDNVVMASDRSEISESLQRNVLNVNKTDIIFEINPFDPFKEPFESSNPISAEINSLSPLVAGKVLDSMSANEIRDLIGLKAENVPVIPTTNG